MGLYRPIQLTSVQYAARSSPVIDPMCLYSRRSVPRTLPLYLPLFATLTACFPVCPVYRLACITSLMPWFRVQLFIFFYFKKMHKGRLTTYNASRANKINIV